MRQWMSSAAIILVFCLTAYPGGFPREQNESESGTVLQYGPPKELSQIQDERINESSGIAASIRYPGTFWTHNDSGDSARIFLINKEGKTVATVTLKGVSAVDWEDIDSFKLGGEGYVLIADTGDNARRRRNCVLYVIREPAINIHPGSEGQSTEAEPVFQISFSYEDQPHDCEAVAVDPTTSIIYLVSKDLKESRVYSLPFPAKDAKEPNVARAVATLKMQYPTAMNISPDGKRAVILTYGDAYEYSRKSGETWAQAFSREPRLIKAPARKQGESICYGLDGKTLYLTSEKEHQPLWEIPVLEGAK